MKEENCCICGNEIPAIRRQGAARVPVCSIACNRLRKRQMAKKKCANHEKATEPGEVKVKKQKISFEEWKEILRQRSREQYQKHKAKRKDSHRKYREANKERIKLYPSSTPEKIREYSRKAAKKRRLTNPEKCRLISKKYRHENPEKVREYSRKYKEKNRELILERHRKSRKENPEKYRKYKQAWKKRQAEILLIVTQSQLAEKKLNDLGTDALFQASG